MIKNAGFTIVETMVAIALLGTMLFSAVVLLTRVNDSVALNERIVTATYLVQECHEMVRNVRDTAWRQNLRWNCAFESSTTAPPATEKYFILSNDTFSSPPLPATPQPPECMDSSLLALGTPQFEPTYPVRMGYFNADPANRATRDLYRIWESDVDEVIEGPFYRRVTFDYSTIAPPTTCSNNTPEDPACDEVLVDCEVWFYKGGGTRESVRMSQKLTNWYRR